MAAVKPFNISRAAVSEAYERIRKNGGTYGVDKVSLADFAERLDDNLYKIWNRMSSGCYMPPAVRRVQIPKSGDKTRPLGIPTVADRIAQMVVKMSFEPSCEVVFHEQSYGYRPNRSAHMAVESVRNNCKLYSWAIDMDIQSFFDTIDHHLLMKAVRRHTQEKWVLLYIQRWLNAEIHTSEGILKPSGKGTPQGSVISPLLANLFLHYVFDVWMEKYVPYCLFERYADDIIVHCRSLMQANTVRSQIQERFEQCGLQLHPDKTRVVYCKYGKSKNLGKNHPYQTFDFLGFCFKPRRQADEILRVKAKWSFTPAISAKSEKKLMQKVRSWNLGRRTRETLNELADMMNPVIRGWITYYGKFRPSELYNVLYRVNALLVKWASRKFGKFKRSRLKASNWLKLVYQREPALFVHWKLVKANWSKQ